jgi:hypothetical protein
MTPGSSPLELPAGGPGTAPVQSPSRMRASASSSLQRAGSTSRLEGRGVLRQQPRARRVRFTVHFDYEVTVNSARPDDARVPLVILTCPMPAAASDGMTMSLANSHWKYP